MELSPAEIRGQHYEPRFQPLRQLTQHSHEGPMADPPSTSTLPTIAPPPPSQIPSSTVGSWLPRSPPDSRELFPSSFHTHSARNDELGNFPPEAMLQDLSKHITKDGKYAIARGGFGEIWKCTLRTDGRSAKVRLQCCFSISLKLIIGQVAVKAFHAYAADQLGAAKTKKIKVNFSTQDRVFSLCVTTS